MYHSDFFAILYVIPHYWTSLLSTSSNDRFRCSKSSRWNLLHCRQPNLQCSYSSRAVHQGKSALHSCKCSSFSLQKISRVDFFRRLPVDITVFRLYFWRSWPVIWSYYESFHPLFSVWSAIWWLVYNELWRNFLSLSSQSSWPTFLVRQCVSTLLLAFQFFVRLFLSFLFDIYCRFL